MSHANLHSDARAKKLTLIEEQPPSFSTWASRICWCLALLAILSMPFSASQFELNIYRATSALDRLEIVVNRNAGVTQTTVVAAAFAILATMFRILNCLQSFRSSIANTSDKETTELLAAIRNELAWQRQQKEKELHRAKAAAAKHAPTDGT